MNDKLTTPILPGTAASDYERYLRTDELLALQKSAADVAHRDEHLFQTVHQSSELWLNAFVDGLRLDVAHRVADRLAGGSVEVELTTSLAALPTVTQTAKAALVPVADGVLVAGPDLHPANAATGTKASIQVLRP